jgi:hypothetical protein
MDNGYLQLIYEPRGWCRKKVVSIHEHRRFANVQSYKSRASLNRLELQRRADIEGCVDTATGRRSAVRCGQFGGLT